jgi:hypothetical protein
MKKNCWEFKNCGREPGGAKVSELGICPAAKCSDLDKIHDGKNSGRSCWIICGTFCEGEVQGTFAKKFENCQKCDFYKLVRNEEGPKFRLSNTLLNILKKEKAKI